MKRFSYLAAGGAGALSFLNFVDGNNTMGFLMLLCFCINYTIGGTYE